MYEEADFQYIYKLSCNIEQIKISYFEAYTCKWVSDIWYELELRTVILIKNVCGKFYVTCNLDNSTLPEMSGRHRKFLCDLSEIENDMQFCFIVPCMRIQ